MEFLRVLPLRGPNQWAWFPVMEAWLDLGVWNNRASHAIPGFNERLMAWLPSMEEHHCSFGERGGFFRSLREGTYLAHILEHVALELEGLAGDEVSFGKSRQTSDPAVFRVVIKYSDEDLAYECLEAGLQLVLAAVEDRPYDVAGTLARLKDFGAKNLPSPGADALIQAARRRNIPWLRPVKTGLLLLGQGSKQRRVRGGETDRTGAIAYSVAEDRDLVRKLLQGAGVPVADGYVVASAEDAWETAEEYLGLPVTVKPHFGMDETAVAENLTTREQVEAAYRAAREESSSVVVERYVAGPRVGLLVVGGKVLSPAGVARDIETHAVRAAHVVGLDIAVVETVGDLVVQVHGAPSLDAHAALSAEQARAIGDAVVGLLFPPGQNGRIPIAAVTGTNGKTTVTRFLAHVLEGTGARVGLTCTDGVYYRGRRIKKGDCSGPSSARSLLMNPLLDMAVLETARGGILRGGLAFNECQVAVVTNLASGDHLGIRDINTVEDLAVVKRMIVEVVSPAGWAVLNAADPLVAAMAPHCPGRVLFFARDAGHPLIVEHRAAGGRALFVRENEIVLASGDQEQPLVSLEDVAVTHHGRIPFEVENALATLGAAVCLSVDREILARQAATFQPDLATVPTRFNVIEHNGATVVVDFGHNVDALRAVIQALATFPQERRVAVFSASGDRRDQDIQEMGVLLGDAFDHVILYEDTDLYERAAGAIIALLRQGLARGTRVKTIVEMEGGLNAFRHAWETVQPGELLLAQAHLADPAVEYLRSHQEAP